MDLPSRIFFITTVTARRTPHFRFGPAADMLLETLLAYRDKGIFALYEFVIMHDHVHLLLAPSANVSLEKTMQFIKGGYSHRYRKETGSLGEIWERSFTNHHVRDWNDYDEHVRYIRLNPVRARLCTSAETYAYSSAYPQAAIDAPPQRLKPVA
jgi:putative transposase